MKQVTQTQETFEYFSLAEKWLKTKKGFFDSNKMIVKMAIAEYLANEDAKTIFSK